MRRFLPSHASLHAFDASVRYLSFTKAAEELCITQSAISRQVTNLETFLGIRLFERIGPKLILTDLGKRYHQQISDLMDQMEAASIEAVRGRSRSTFLQLAMPPTLQRRWAVPFLHEFSKRHPDCLYELLSCQNEVDAATLEADFIFLRGTGQWPSCRVTRLFDERLVVVGAASILPEGRELTHEEFAKYTLFQNISRPSLWMTWLRRAKVPREGPIAGPRFEVTDTLITAVEQAGGLAVVPEYLVQSELRSSKLKLAFETKVLSGEQIYICRPEARGARPEVTIFQKWFNKYCSDGMDAPMGANLRR